MGVKYVALIFILWGGILSGYGLNQTTSPLKIALLAPFEGRYREIGYDALYAAHLALFESQREDVVVLPIDDGGSVETASHRVQALVRDPLVKAVLVLGYHATDVDVQAELDNLPMVVVGNWSFSTPGENVFILSHPEITTYLDANMPLELIEAVKMQTPYTGNEILALKSFPELRPDTNGFFVASSSLLPDEDFIERILRSDPFAPPPGLLSTSVYDAVGLLLDAVPNLEVSRIQVLEAIENNTYTGIMGQIVFENHYWESAPIYLYEYQDGKLILSDYIIEQR